jgi:hypothetical protein
VAATEADTRQNVLFAGSNGGCAPVHGLRVNHVEEWKLLQVRQLRHERL